MPIIFCVHKLLGDSLLESLTVQYVLLTPALFFNANAIFTKVVWVLQAAVRKRESIRLKLQLSSAPGVLEKERMHLHYCC